MAFGWNCDQQVYELFYIWDTDMNLFYKTAAHRFYLKVANDMKMASVTVQCMIKKNKY